MDQGTPTPQPGDAAPRPDDVRTPAPAGNPAPPPARGTGGAPFIIAAILSVAIAGGAGIAVALARPQGSVPVAVAFAATPAPASPATPRATASAAPAPATDDAAVLAAFDAAALRPDLSYRMTVKTVYQTSDGTATRSSGTFAVSGTDYHAEITVDGGETDDVYVIRNVAYTRDAKGRYRKAPTVLAERRWVPFLDLTDPREITVAGTTTRSGRAYHVLRTTDWYMPDNARMLNLTRLGSVTDEGLELLVDDLGIPHYGTFTIEIDTTGGTATGRVEFTFSDFGEPLKIALPK